MAAFTAVRAGVTRIPYGQAGRCSYVAVLVDGTLSSVAPLIYAIFIVNERRKTRGEIPRVVSRIYVPLHIYTRGSLSWVASGIVGFSRRE